MNADAQGTVWFLERRAELLPLYETLMEALLQRFPDTEIRVQKTQISLYRRRMYGCVSLLRPGKKAELPERYLVLTLGLPAPLESPRAAVQTEPYPGRWTAHLVISDAQQIDDELLRCVARAYDWAIRK